MISNWHKAGVRPYAYSENVGRKDQKPKGDVAEFERLVRSGMQLNQALKLTGVSTHQQKLIKQKLEAEKLNAN